MQIPHLHQCQIQQPRLLSCSDVKLMEFSLTDGSFLLTGKLEGCLHVVTHAAGGLLYSNCQQQTVQVD